MRCQNSPLALLYRFAGILGLFENGDPIMECDDREDCDLFDFRKPNQTERHLIGIPPQSAEDLPPADACPCTSRERYECILVVVPQETTRAEFVGIRPVLRCETYHSIAQIMKRPHVRLWCIAVIIGINVVPLGTGSVLPDSVVISQSSAASFMIRDP